MGVAKALCAAHTPQACITLGAIHPPTPGGRYSLPEPTRLTLDARWLRCAAKLGCQSVRDSQLREIRLGAY